MESEKLKPYRPKKSKAEESYSTRLNQELNAQDADWVQVHQELKESGIAYMSNGCIHIIINVR